MHARSSFNDNLVMVSDILKGKDVAVGDNIQLSIDIDEVGILEKVFSKMAEGGTTTMPLQDTFLGARFGMLKDKFGTFWMFIHELKKD